MDTVDSMSVTLCFANIPTAVRITTETCASRPEAKMFSALRL